MIFYYDRGQHFNNQKLKNYFKFLEIILVFNSLEASKSIGLIKRGNRILEEVMAKKRYD